MQGSLSSPRDRRRECQREALLVPRPPLRRRPALRPQPKPLEDREGPQRPWAPAAPPAPAPRGQPLQERAGGSLPSEQLQAKALTVADRYCGQMWRLSEQRLAWRRRQEAKGLSRTRSALTAEAAGQGAREAGSRGTSPSVEEGARSSKASSDGGSPRAEAPKREESSAKEGAEDNAEEQPGEKEDDRELEEKGSEEEEEEEDMEELPRQRRSASIPERGSRGSALRTARLIRASMQGRAVTMGALPDVVAFEDEHEKREGRLYSRVSVTEPSVEGKRARSPAAAPTPPPAAATGSRRSRLLFKEERSSLKGFAVGEQRVPSKSQLSIAAPAGNRPASPSLVPLRMVKRWTDTDVVRLAKKYRLELSEVREQLEEFQALDADGCGTLTRQQFLGLLRRRLALEEGQELPEAAIAEAQRVANTDQEHVDFEDFVAWSWTVTFSPNLKLWSEEDKKLRELAQSHNVDMHSLERIWADYQKFDTDNSGDICKLEFQRLLRVLMNSKDDFDMPKQRLESFWADADLNKDGVLNFEEFLVWYMKYFAVGEDLTTAVYRRLGSDRTARSSGARRVGEPWAWA